MSSDPSNEQQQLILQLLLNRIPEQEFLRRYPLKSPADASAAGAIMLERASRAQDPSGVEFALYLGHRFGITDAYGDALCDIAAAKWHERHEDVVDALAKLRLPKSVDALYSAAITSLPYRAYDASDSLGVKVTWALRRIESVLAIQKLGQLLHGGSSIVSKEARSRLLDVVHATKLEEVRHAALRELEH